MHEWDTITVHAVWDKLGYKGEGVGWFAKEITLSGEAAARPVLIGLGPIHNRGVLYVNGRKVEGPHKAGEKPVYVVPADFLKEGTNLLAVRVYKFWSFGGFTGKPSDMFVSTASGSVALAGTWHFRPGFLSRNPQLTQGPNAYIGSLYQAMVHPFHYMPLKGFIWYQGENNVSRADDYAWHLRQLVADWRNAWGDSTLPFLVVQLPNYKGPASTAGNYALIRHAQQASTTVPGVHMAVTLDVGDSADIHPRNKQPVGYRLHLLARKYAYAEENLLAEGPVPGKPQQQGAEVVIPFSNTGAGLKTTNAYDYLYGFELAGSDGIFYPAAGRIENHKVVIRSNQVAEPSTVRYAWSDNPTPGLFNAEGLPAAPFLITIQ
jgi:sialate O-acetylesterase